MTRNEIDSILNLLVLAGSGETTSVALSMATYFALKNPTILDQLRSEIGDERNLTVPTLSRLPYSTRFPKRRCGSTPRSY